MDNYSSSAGGTVPNSNATAAIENNLFRSPRDKFGAYQNGFGLGWLTLGGATITEKYAPGPHAWDSGFTGASRVVIPVSSTGFLQATFKIANGSMTHAVWLKSNTGVDQTVRLSWNAGATRTSITVTSAWQRFTQSFTSVGTATPRLESDSVNAIDVLICDWKCYAGAVEADLEPVGHCYFGNVNNTTIPSASSGVLDMTSVTGQYGCIDFLDQPSTNDLTIIAFVSKTNSGAGYERDQIFGSAGNGLVPDMSLIEWENDEMVSMRKNGSNDLAGTGFFNLLNRGWHQLAVVQDGTGSGNNPLLQMLDDAVIFRGRTSTGSSTVRNWEIGFARSAITTRKLSYKIHAIAMWDAALSISQIRDVFSYWKERALPYGLTFSPIGKTVCFEGDSKPSASNSYAHLYAASGSPRSIVTKTSASGSTLATMIARASSVDERLTGGNNILCIDIGTNDLSSVASESQWLTDYASYCDARRAAGWKVVIITVLPKSALDSNLPLFLSRRATVNAAFRTWVGIHCDAISDVAANSVIGDDADASNVTYYSDGVHNTSAGYAIHDSITRPVIDAL